MLHGCGNLSHPHTGCILAILFTPQTCSICQAEGSVYGGKQRVACVFKSIERQDFYHWHDELIELHVLMTKEKLLFSGVAPSASNLQQALVSC